MRTAVVGHVEWVDFVRVAELPRAGEIVHAGGFWEQAGGGGAVAAVQLAKLAGNCTFFTAFGDDDRGRRAKAELEALGVRVEAVVRPEPQRRAVTLVDAHGERTITVLGDRLVPNENDPLPWSELAQADAAYLTGCGPGAVRLARKARILVATSRVLPLLQEAAVPLDAVVGSALDTSEAYADGDLDPPPRLAVLTEGERGGSFFESAQQPRRFEAVEVEARIVDTYGAGDSFAAGLTHALAKGLDAEEAVAFAARCGAAVLRGAGPFESQLRA